MERSSKRRQTGQPAQLLSSLQGVLKPCLQPEQAHMQVNCVPCCPLISWQAYRPASGHRAHRICGRLHAAAAAARSSDAVPAALSCLADGRKQRLLAGSSQR